MRAIDLFCGCGGLSLGFQQAGVEIVAAFENWPYAVACYRQNFQHPVIEIDLSNVKKAISYIAPYTPDLIIGGPPCQDFSIAGNREEGKRADLTLAFAEIVCSLAPRYFVMENVERASCSRTYATARKLLKDNGYGLTERVLNACYFGVPQNRKRFFCIGVKGASDNAIDGLLLSGQSVLPMTIREYYNQNEMAIPFDYYYRHPRTYNRRGIFSIDEPAPTIRGVNRPRPSQYRKHENDASDPEHVRSMTPRERATIQTFPLTFHLPENSSSAEQMIGNAVPVKLAEHVGRCVMAYSKGADNGNDLRFIDWLMQRKNYSSRAASDVLSRIKRANRIVTLDEHDLDEILITLQTSNEFSRITKTVQSQIKRALRFYYEYCNREER